MRFYLLLVFACSVANIGHSSPAPASKWNQSIVKKLAFFDQTFPHLQLMKPIRSILPTTRLVLTKAMVNRCYDRFLANDEIDMFKPDITVFQVLHDYYKSQPQKRITLTSIESLIKSARTIAEHTIQCASKPKRYKLGFTSMSDLTLEEFRSHMGASLVKSVPSESGSHMTRAVSSECYAPSTFTVPDKINWTEQGVVSPVRYQGGCNACWSFAVVGAIESAFLKKSNTTLDLSEQQHADCAKGDGTGCKSGTSWHAFNYTNAYGITSEELYPYVAKAESCKTWMNDEAVANIRSFCIRGKNGYNKPNTKIEYLNEAEMTKAVAYFGPVSVCLNANLLQSYKSGIFDDPNCQKGINHNVLMVGYTPDAWILKNSWGKGWGESGFFRLARHNNTCGIDFEIAYPLL